MSENALPAAVATLVGQRCYGRESDFCVNPAVVRAMCAAVENGNPVYWDAQAALHSLGDQ